MRGRQIGQAHPFHMQVAALVMDVRVAGQDGWTHGWREGVGADAERAGADAAAAGPLTGNSSWPNVGRGADAGPAAGMYSGPFWPQPASRPASARVATAMRRREGRGVSRICADRNIWKL